MVSGQKPLDGALFSGGPVLGPVDQIGVYADQYRLRLYPALEEEVIGLKALLGAEALKPLLWRYLEACPSQTWTLARIAERLEGWLREQDAPIEQIEMAALDRAVQRGFTAGDGTPLTIEQLASLPPLRLHPAVSLLRHTTNVHEIRSAAYRDDRPAIRHELDVHLVIYRKGLRLAHRELEPGAWHLLSHVQRGAPLEEGLEAMLADGHIQVDTVADDIQRWMKTFAELGLVQAAE